MAAKKSRAVSFLVSYDASSSADRNIDSGPGLGARLPLASQGTPGKGSKRSY